MSRQRSMEAILASEYVSIGELARLTGTRYSTLKFYTEEGLLPFKQVGENLTRRYLRDETVKLVSSIKKMKADGMNLLQIKERLGSS